MFDIGFFELLVIGCVLLVVMGPERLPEVAQQIASFIRKTRQGLFRLRSQMQDEIDGTPFADIEAAQREIADLKNDIRQLGKDLAKTAEAQVVAAEKSKNPESESESQLDDSNK